jgi:hypothetical protein
MAAAVHPSPILPLNMNANKRKRGNDDIGRNDRTNNTAPEDNDYSSLLQGIADTAQDDSTRTAQAALAGAMNQTGYPEPNPFDAGSAMGSGFDATTGGLDGSPDANMYPTPTREGGEKPQVGTAEWHRTRKNMHKEGKLSTSLMTPILILSSRAPS